MLDSTSIIDSLSDAVRSAPPHSLEDLPTVTVVVTCFKQERFVRQALDAVAAQSYPSIFLIVTDDASPDSSVNVIEEFLIHYEGEALFIRNEQNIGLCATLNLARRHIRGDYVAFISADDWMESHRIERQVEALEVLGSSYGACYSDAYRVDEGGGRLPLTILQWRFSKTYRPSGAVFEALIDRNFIPAPSVLIRSAALVDAGEHDEALAIEDYDMWLRISREWLFAFVAEPLVSYRDVQGSMFESIELPVVREQKITSLRKHLGISARTDELLVDRIASLAIDLYKHGRATDQTVKDLRPVLGRAPFWTNLSLYVVARLGVSWALISRIRHPIINLRSRPRLQR